MKTSYLARMYYYSTRYHYFLNSCYCFFERDEHMCHRIVCQCPRMVMKPSLSLFHVLLQLIRLEGNNEGKSKGGMRSTPWFDNVTDWTGVACMEFVRAVNLGQKQLEIHCGQPYARRQYLIDCLSFEMFAMSLKAMWCTRMVYFSVHVHILN